MARDRHLKSKNEQRRSKRVEKITRKKNFVDSDSDQNEDSDSDSDEMDVHEYRKFLSKIFPSKHLNNKIKAGDKLKKVIEDEFSDEEPVSKKYVTSKNNKNNKKKFEEDDICDTESEEDTQIVQKKSKNTKRIDEEEEYEYDEDDDEEEEEEDYNFKSKNKNINIIFTIGGSKEEDEDEWEDCDSDSDYVDEEDVTEDEDIEVSTDESDNEEDEDEEFISKKVKNDSSRKKLTENNTSENNTSENNTSENNTSENNNNNTVLSSNQTNTLEQLKKLLEINPTDKSIKKCINAYEDDIKAHKFRLQKKENKQKDKNMRIFKKNLKDKNSMNDFSFYEKLDIENQKKIIKELREINKNTRIEKPYRLTLLESNIPVEFKSAAMKKINSLKYMEPGSGEFYKSKNWVDTFMRIPFNKYHGLPISIDDGVDKCHEFMENAQKTLDQAVYGLNDAKMQIMQMLGQLLTNPKAIGTAIAIHGPPGTGKTSLVKEGISKILNRPFAFIALGGATDSSFLEGHGYTYEGSTWGKIVQIIIDSKCMNPVIYFDELDKISDTPRGEEIAGILTHLTDTSQNSQFHDKYFAEINFDLSKCLFIFSYNDEHKVNSILKDRMYRIKTKGYDSKEKTAISNNYLLPKIREQVRFNIEDITIPNDIIGHIITTYCNKEDGVRNLKRCLEIIHTKINLYRLMKPGSNLFEGEMSIKVEFPFIVTKEIVDKLIKRESDGLETWRNLYN
jgi:ATP-dependent Lon protease